MERGEKTFTGRVREAARGLGPFRSFEIAGPLGIASSDTQMQALRSTIRDLYRLGELKRLERGLYQYVAPKQKGVRQRLWDVVRRMPARNFTLDDLEQLTGCKRNTVKWFCEWMVNAGYAVRKVRGLYAKKGEMCPDVPVERRGKEHGARSMGHGARSKEEADEGL